MRPFTSYQLALGLLLTLGFVSVFAAPVARAAVMIPQNMNAGDRQEALRIVGLGTGPKALTDPYSLGGYSGLEFGLSLETVPTEDLARLGNRLTSPQADVTIPKFTIGKGLFSNLDFFIHFIPYNQRTELSQYGGMVRWSFYEGSSVPISASLIGHMNSGNIGNLMTTRSFGIDFMGGINVNEVALYAGVGVIQATGSFAGGTSGVTNSGRYEIEGVSALHTVAGGTVRIRKVFFAVQLDRYTQSVLSGKIGLRF